MPVERQAGDVVNGFAQFEPNLVGRERGGQRPCGGERLGVVVEGNNIVLRSVDTEQRKVAGGNDHRLTEPHKHLIDVLPGDGSQLLVAAAN